MLLVPVLEIRHGKSVRTVHKTPFTSEVLKEDILSVVQNWHEKGVKRLHVVDVDAIESGEPENVDWVAKVKQQFPDLAIQVIGGVKCIESAYVWMDAGADYLVLTGKVMRRRDLLDELCVEFPNKVLVEVDCRKGQANVLGKPMSLTEVAKQLEEDGVVGLVVNDVHSHNSDEPIEYRHIQELTESVQIPVFANGLVGQLSDLKSIADTQSDKLGGVLLGRAVHQENFCLNKAQNIVAECSVS